MQDESTAGQIKDMWKVITQKTLYWVISLYRNHEFATFISLIQIFTAPKSLHNIRFFIPDLRENGQSVLVGLDIYVIPTHELHFFQILLKCIQPFQSDWITNSQTFALKILIELLKQYKLGKLSIGNNIQI